MNPKMLRAVRHCNLQLRATATENYLSLLRFVVEDHPRALWYGDATLAVDSAQDGNYLPLIELADSLASQQYSSAGEHFLASQFSSLIRKYPFPKDLVVRDPRSEALKKFWHAEHSCKRVNQRFRCFERRSPYESKLARMRSWISYVLGTTVPYENVWATCEFGPGASLGVHGNATNRGRKYLAEKWSVLPGSFEDSVSAMKRNSQAVELLNSRKGSPFYSLDYVLFRENMMTKMTVVNYNKISFVPKTALVHRTIAVEPLLTSFVQKGIDTVMRERLARVGIDLRTQEINRELARKGSRDPDSWVTIDLSSASDSISTELVRALLPPDWFDFLNRNRSKEFLLDGKFYPYEKFCSMGNGFCFPLETLVFAACCIAVDAGVPGRDFVVYGDDIVVPRRVSQDLLSLLKVCGFKTNDKKTFLQGSFRESCGADWYGGEDVRPMVLDFALDSVQSVFKFLNLTQRSERCKTFFAGVWDEVLSLLPDELQFLRPCKGNEDSAVTVEFDRFISSYWARYKVRLQCWSWTELLTSPVSDSGLVGIEGYSTVLTIAALSGSVSTKPFTLRRKTRTKVRRVSHSGGHSTWLPAPHTLMRCQEDRKSVV